MAISLPDTAFVIACYRANHEMESCDPFAKLWVKPGLQHWVDDFAKKVSKYDEILHCMRNRFFYEKLQSLLDANDKLLCLNLGAGFSMYPYHLSEAMITFEADFENVMKFKEEATAAFEDKGLLPKRRVTFVPADITNTSDQDALAGLLRNYTDHRKVIIIEGVFFFLDRRQIESVVEFCRRILSRGDILLTVSFEAQTATSDVFSRLTSYFENELHSEGIYTTIPHSYYETLEGFRLTDRDSTLSLAKSLSLVPKELEELEVLNEYCYSLERM